MLKKRNRLKNNSAFRATYRNRSSVSDKSIVLYIGQEKSDKNCPTRVGFVVSKKIHKRAVVRNKIKRLMRENVRHIICENALPDKFQSLIFMARDNILDKDYSQIKCIINNLINKMANKNI
ncbi:ribonuclease P protein component [bacterium]|nr:ribonuclease P protein component [bacterium]